MVDNDTRHLQIIRRNVSAFVERCARAVDREGIRVLDIAPSDHEGAVPYFKKAKVETLDIDPRFKPTYVADLCKCNGDIIPDETFDFVVCTEVLEHVCQPFFAVDEIRRVLKKEGAVFVTVPFNFMIHPPYPDCWRFTEYGLKELFKGWKMVELNGVWTDGRAGMPVQYILVAKKE
jgi:SAM-dependent methyltransferase